MSKYIIVFTFFFCSQVQASVYFIKSAKVDLLSAAEKGSDVVATLERDTEVKELDVDRTWVKVESDGKAGWVSKIFLSKKKSMGTSQSLLDTDEDLSSSARKRASALTSAGAARGLRAGSDQLYQEDGEENLAALKIMESWKVDDEVGLEFLMNPQGEL